MKLRLILLGVVLFGVAAAQQKVDNNTIFQLNGLAQRALGVPSAADDWDCYFWSNPPEAQPLGCPKHATTASFKPNVTNKNTFTSGSKDTAGIGTWSYSSGSVPDKDDIQHAYALAYNPSGELLVYFGADRYANNGNANLGFWFFKSAVSISGGTFGGTHSDGDLFVTSTFTSGGLVSSIMVYKWSCGGGTGSTCDSTGSLVPFSPSAGITVGECKLGAGTNDACAIANKASTPSPWAFTPKSGPANQFGIAEFFEGGLNVKTLLNSTDACFASFMAETRSSSSTSATLEDFVLTKFEDCSGSLTKQCTNSTLNAAGTKFVDTFGGQVHNSGGALYDVTVTEVLPSDTTDVMVGGVDVKATKCTGGSSIPVTCKFVYAGPLATDACLRWPNMTPVTCGATPSNSDYGTFQTATNGAGDSATLSAAMSSGGNQLPLGAANATCPLLPSSPALSVTKGCSTSFPATPNFQSLALTVSFNGYICNQGNVDLTNVAAMDVQTTPAGGQLSGAGVSAAVTFPAGFLGTLPKCPTPGTCSSTGTPASCVSFTGSYLPTITSGGTDACSYAFSDQVTVTADPPAVFGGSISQTSNVATCHMCPCTTSTQP